MQKVFLDQFFRRLHRGTFRVKYWDGTSKQYGEGEPNFTLNLNKPLSTVNLAKDPVLELGEAYMEGIIDIDGELKEVIKMVYANQDVLFIPKSKRLTQGALKTITKLSSLTKQKEDVQYHYDLGNDFFALWLDETMSYSCAYFHTPEDTLKQAQLQKIDHTLKKLQLKPGESLLDIGSGWGWLIIRAAQQYGVKALGITLSREQYDRTKQRISDLGLGDLVEVELLDYRELAGSGRVFDKVASIGMLEHVGRAHLGQYMASVNSLLKPGGLALIHSITDMFEGSVNSWINKYIFPGGYIPSLRELVWLLPEHDFHVLDIESLRMHYAMTLDRWADNFERNVDKVCQDRGERFMRMWRLYLRACAESFRASGLNIHQILVSKGLNNDLPLTRSYLYQ